MNCTNSQIFAHKYSCDIRNVNFVNCKSKLFVSRYNRFDVSNLFNEIRFALFANLNFKCFTRVFLLISKFFEMIFSYMFCNKDFEFVCVYFIHKIWKIVVIAIFAFKIFTFEKSLWSSFSHSKYFIIFFDF